MTTIRACARSFPWPWHCGSGSFFSSAPRGRSSEAADSPPLPIFFGFAIPLAVFFAAYFGWSAFRAFVLGADLRLVAAIQAWRWAGLGFLSLYAQGVLPGLFAFPAGLGDMAIGFTAPWIVLGLIRHPSFAASRRYVIWNIMGIIDLVVAVSMGTLCSGFLHGLTGTSPRARWHNCPWCSSRRIWFPSLSCCTSPPLPRRDNWLAPGNPHPHKTFEPTNPLFVDNAPSTREGPAIFTSNISRRKNK